MVLNIETVCNKPKLLSLLKISAAESRFFGSAWSILSTKSFAPLDIEGQGSDE